MPSVIGTIRRERLDWMIPMSEAHLRSIVREWVTHYNGARPTASWGPECRILHEEMPASLSLAPRHRDVGRAGAREIRLAVASRVQARSHAGERLADTPEGGVAACRRFRK